MCPVDSYCTDTSLLLQTICSSRLQSGKRNTSVTEYLTNWSRVQTRLHTRINGLVVEATNVCTSANLYTLIGKFGSDPSNYKMEATYFSETPLPASKTVSKPRPKPETPLPTLMNTCKLAWMLTGLDLITARMVKELWKEGLVNRMYIFIAILRLEYWPKSLKIAQIIMVPKPGKNPMDTSFYQPISLLPTTSKALEKLILKKSINKAMENQQYCTATFLDISQAFDKVWHPGLLFKIKRFLSSSYLNLPKSYLNERQFGIKFNGESSRRFHIHSGVPWGSSLGPLLYVL